MGVSLLALCIAGPALAGQTKTVVGGTSLPPDVSIDAGDVYQTGVTAEGDPAATSEVNSVPNGTVEQVLHGDAARDAGALNLDSAGTVAIGSVSTATNASGQAIANAQLRDGVAQIITAPNTNLAATMSNSGSLMILSSATASGTDFNGDVAARATSSLIGGVHQEVTVEGGGGGAATATANNDGLYRAGSVARAEAEGDALANATLQEAIFMRAQANGAGDGVTQTTLNNNGQLDFAAAAAGISTSGAATANATAGAGEHGLIHIRGAANGVGLDSTTVSFNNNAGSSLVVLADAQATALTQADAAAVADGALLMKGQASGQDEGDIALTLNNRGTIAVTAGSLASSTDASGGANAVTTLNSALVQTTEAGGPANRPFRNGASVIHNDADAAIAIAGTASATSLGTSAASVELAPAILQEAEMTGIASTRFDNAGTVTANGAAIASGSNATAAATVGGVEHEIFGVGGVNAASAVFDNSGTLTVGALSDALGSVSSSAQSAAFGFKVWGDPIDLAGTNGGTIAVSSSATADNGSAVADALGLNFLATFDPTIVVPEEGEDHGHGGTEGHSPDNGQNGHGGDEGEGPVVWEEDATNAISGSFANIGALTVSATAQGTAGQVANAKGAYFESAVNNSTLINGGSLIVSAASNGGAAQAVGIAVRDFAESPILPGAGDVFTLVNDGGTITARQSTNLGANWSHGLAIDTSLAPNRARIVFLGASQVYGDIDISDDDAITIAGGVLRLDGLINPTEALEGTLSISDGATLFLMDPRYANPDYDGPAGANVQGFTMAEGGTLALQLSAEVATPPVTLASLQGPIGAAIGSPLAYPQIFTDTADLAGTLLVQFTLPGGLAEDAYEYQDIIDANTRNGEFSEARTTSASPLFVPSLFYDSEANVDLVINRIGFGEVEGLTFNQNATGDAIEAVYSPAQTGAYGDLLAELFTKDADGYPAALDQISGDQYAGYLKGLLNQNIQIDTMVSEQLDCAANKRGLDACRRPDQGLRMWALGNYNDASTDTDINAPGTDLENWAGLIGVDYAFDSVSVGAFGGYRKSTINFDRNAGRIEADGFQLGLLAAYDVGDFYLRGLASYSELGASSYRTVALGPVTGAILGEPDAHIWSLYAETGGRVAAGNSWLTPFLALDHSRLSLNGFTESGVAGANLELPDQTDSQTALLAGLKWAGQMGAVRPEAKIAYRRDLGDPFTTSTARFVDAPGNSLFTVRSVASDQDSILAGFSLAASLSDRVTGRLGYQGRFAGGVNDNALYASLLMRLGGIVAPALSELKPASGDPTFKLGLDVTGAYDDNIFGTRNDKLADYIVNLRPSARVVMGDKSTYVEIGGRGDLARNAEYDSENFSDWTVDMDSRLRLSDSLSLVLNGDYAWTHEARTSPEAVFGLAPTRYQRAYGVAGLLYRQGPLSARLAGSTTVYDFDDAATSLGSINNDDRDRVETELAGRVGYALAGSTDLFVQASVGETRYDSAFDDSGFDRNSDGFGAVFGLRRGDADGLSGEIFAGLLQRSFDDPTLEDVKTFDFGLLVDWTGRNSEASFRIDRSLGETIFPGASAYVQTAGSISVSAAAGPRLAVGVTLRGTQYDYVGISRREFVLNSELWTRYWLGKHVYAGLGYNFTQRASNAVGYEYDANRFMVSLGTQLQPRYLDSANALSWTGGGQAPGGAYAAILLGHGTLVSGVAGPRNLVDFSTADFGNDGAAYGVAAGYGVMLEPIYLGLELSAMGDGPAWSHNGERTFSVDKDNGVELAVRAGYVTNGRSLVYGRFGYASARFTTAYDAGTENILLEDRRSGMSLGFGVEAPASKRSFFRAEYVVNGYSDYDVTLANGSRDNFSNVEGQFRLGFGLRLGQSAASDVAPTDFAGAYAGLFVGHGALASRVMGARDGQAPLDATRSSQGGVLGGFAGYGVLAGGFYLGAEIGANLSNIDWQVQGEADGRSYSSQHQYSFGAAARLGHLIGPSALVYGRVGAVRTRFDTNYQTVDVSVSSNDTRTGLQLGGGLEIGLGSRSRIRVEYIRNDYGAYNINYGSSSEQFDHSETIFKTGILFAL